MNSISRHHAFNKFFSTLPQNKLRVGVLGATGVVGQRFLELLEVHPYFEVVKLGASERSAGKKYSDVVLWRGEKNIPFVEDDIVKTTEVKNFQDVDLVFSGMDNKPAFDVEMNFAKAGIPVFSNAGSHRANDHVPCIAIMSNPEHMLQMIPMQQKKYEWKNGGFIVTNPNCTTTGTVSVLTPIHNLFGIKKVFVTSMQAISGSGYPGVPSMDIVDNVVPYIGNEEEKMQWESQKIMGNVGDDGIVKYADFQVSAHCNRVAVTDGHTVCLSIELENKNVSVEMIKSALKNYQPEELYQYADVMPYLPTNPIRVREEENRPQPRFDRMEGGGFTTCVGRVRPCPLFDVKLHLTSHNTIIGAAGGSILNAEYARAVGLLSPFSAKRI